jgi:hypothetical protein
MKKNLGADRDCVLDGTVHTGTRSGISIEISTARSTRSLDLRSGNRASTNEHRGTGAPYDQTRGGCKIEMTATENG